MGPELHRQVLNVEEEGKRKQPRSCCPDAMTVSLTGRVLTGDREKRGDLTSLIPEQPF